MHLYHFTLYYFDIFSLSFIIGGALARPITRMSFRHGVKGFFGLKKKKSKTKNIQNGTSTQNDQQQQRELLDNMDAYSDTG